MMRPLALIGVLIAFVTVVGLSLIGDGMATCQIHRSFDVCHAAIH